MPRAPKHCGNPGCTTLVTARTYCDEHQPEPWQTKTPHRTGTADYKRWRAAVMANANGQCQIKGVGCTGQATQADHIVPIAEGGEKYNVSNGQGVCGTCHKRKTLQETQRGKQRNR